MLPSLSWQVFVALGATQFITWDKCTLASGTNWFHLTRNGCSITTFYDQVKVLPLSVASIVMFSDWRPDFNWDPNPAGICYYIIKQRTSSMIELGSRYSASSKSNHHRILSSVGRANFVSVENKLVILSWLHFAFEIHWYLFIFCVL